VFSCNLKKERNKIKISNDSVFVNLKSKINPKNFESVINGKLTKLYVLRYMNGLEAIITNFG
jgi:hypothetical protein